MKENVSCHKLIDSLYFAQESISKNGMHLFIRYDDTIKATIAQDNMSVKFSAYYAYYMKRIAYTLREWDKVYILDGACKDMTRPLHTFLRHCVLLKPPRNARLRARPTQCHARS